MNPPVGKDAVTTPVVVTVCPANGLTSVLSPWISAIVLAPAGVGGGGGGAAVHDVFWGAGAAAVKSRLFLSLSAPEALRVMALVLLGAGAKAVS